jgi:hypothetical protein
MQVQGPPWPLLVGPFHGDGGGTLIIQNFSPMRWKKTPYYPNFLPNEMGKNTLLSKFSFQ